MRPVVALVEATPETVIEDYRRVLTLAGLADVCRQGPLALVPQVDRGGWFPGAGSPPWQLDGTLSWLAGHRPAGLSASAAAPGSDLVIAPVAPRGETVTARGWGWQKVLARHGAALAGPDFWETTPLRPDPPLPSLTAVSPEGLRVPAGLAGRSVLLLPVPALDSAWPVAGAVALLRGLLAPRLGRPGRVPVAEIIAEVVGLAHQASEGLGVVTDAVVWDVRAGGLSRRPVIRNVLLAGTDPVAVDAVTVHLAGRDPDTVAWLRLSRERGLGPSRLQDIDVVGRTDLLDLDFGAGDRTFGGGSILRRPNPVAERAWEVLKKPSIVKKHRQTPWGRLFIAYRTAAVQGDVS